MKTFLVIKKDRPVVVNNKKYYYKNIISIGDKSVESLDECKALIDNGDLVSIENNIQTTNKSKDKKVSEDKKVDKKIDTNKKSSKDENKNNKKEEK